MSGIKNKNVRAKNRVSNSVPVGSISTSNKYHYAPDKTKAINRSYAPKTVCNNCGEEIEREIHGSFKSLWKHKKTGLIYCFRDERTESATPKSNSVRQKRADEWADIEAMENRERIELDAQQYREYMDEQAERAGWIGDGQNGLFFCYSSFIFLMGYVWTFPKSYASLVFILSFLSALFYALQLRGGSSLTPRGKGAKR